MQADSWDSVVDALVEGEFGLVDVQRPGQSVVGGDAVPDRSAISRAWSQQRSSDDSVDTPVSCPTASHRRHRRDLQPPPEGRGCRWTAKIAIAGHPWLPNPTIG